MTRSPTNLGRLLAAALALSAVVEGVSGCGLSENSAPRAIATSDIPSELIDEAPSSSTTLGQSPSTASVTVYYLALQDGITRLTAVPREVVDPTRPKDRIEALLTPPTPDEQEAGITTSIPADTVLLNTDLDESSGELTIDLSTSLFDVQGEELRNAFAQIVWTITELDVVSRVRFLVDGVSIRVPDEGGIEQPGSVARSDYLTLKPVGVP